MANQEITPEIADVLRRCDCSEYATRLPEQLDRGLYEKVNAALVNAGFKWNKTAKAHLLPHGKSSLSKIQDMLASGVSVDVDGNKKKLNQAFYTPALLANTLAKLADVKDRDVLEPSAGHGAIALACLNAGAHSVMCIEQDYDAALVLKQLGLSTLLSDFLTQNPPEEKYDRVVMNPPFSKGQDFKHLAHALKFVAPGGTLVCVMPNRSRFEILKITGLRNLLSLHPLAEGSFRSSGTNIETIAVKVIVTQ